MIWPIDYQEAANSLRREAEKLGAPTARAKLITLAEKFEKTANEIQSDLANCVAAAKQ